MTERDPTFFAGRRISVYFRGGRLMKDGKTEQRFWRLKWALTLQAADAYACGGAIQSTYEHIQARENAAEEIILSGCRGGMIVEVYAGQQKVIRLDRCFLDKFRMTFADGETEFWVQMEHELTDALHKFVKDYAFQRFDVQFQEAQQRLGETPVESSVADGLADELSKTAREFQDRADKSGVSCTIKSGNKTLAEFKPKGKVH